MPAFEKVPLVLLGGDLWSDFGASAPAQSDPGIGVGAHFQRSARLHGACMPGSAAATNATYGRLYSDSYILLGLPA